MKMLLRLLRLLRPLLWKVVAAILLGTATIVSSIGLLGAAAWLIAAAALHPSIAELQVAIVGVRFFGISRGVFRYCERLFSHDLSFRVLAEIRLHFMKQLEKLAPAIFIRHSGGELLNEALSGIESLQNLLIRSLGPPVVGCLIGLGVSLYLALFSLRIALIFTLCYGLSLLFLPMLSWRMEELEAARSEGLKRTLSRELVEMLTHAGEFKLASALEKRASSYLDHSRELEKIERVSALRDALGTGLNLLLQHGAVWLILLVGIPLLEQGLVAGPTLAALALVVMASFEGSSALPQAARQLRHQLQTASKIFALLDEPPPIIEDPHPRPLPATPETSPRIRLEGVNFRYETEEKTALSDIDLEISPGARIALTGASGSGKSTLLHLLLRFNDPTSGHILYDGVDIRRLKADELRRSLGLLSQQTQLFTGTVAENLRMAQPGAGNEALEDACRKARILEEIRALPAGLETWIGTGGLQLSGGQRRRLALARLLLQDPRVFLLDEVTAHLDRGTSAELMDSLFEHVGTRSLIHVTHRLEKMERYDEIFVLDQGRNVERGGHQELLDTGGLYARLWKAGRDLLDS